jgi:hypothetical protein
MAIAGVFGCNFAIARWPHVSGSNWLGFYAIPLAYCGRVFGRNISYLADFASSYNCSNNGRNRLRWRRRSSFGLFGYMFHGFL